MSFISNNPFEPVKQTSFREHKYIAAIRAMDKNGLFYLAFFICIGFLPPFITIIGGKELTYPFVIVSVLAAITMLVAYATVTHSLWQVWNMAFITIVMVITYIYMQPSAHPNK